MKLRMDSNITGELYFFSHKIDDSPPWMDSNPKLDWTATNYARTPARVTIHDLRGRENTVDLDNNGFELLKYDGHIHDVFHDNTETQRCYYEDIVDALKKHLGASRIVIFNHVMRSRGPPRAADQCDSASRRFVATIPNIRL